MPQVIQIEGLEVVDGAALVSQKEGKYTAAVRRGRVFHQTTTPLGLAIPIYTGTGIPGCVVWNVPSSGVKVVPLSYAATRTSGTAAFAAIGMMARQDMGADLATGSEITAFAQTTPINAQIGAGQASRVRSSNAGTITIRAGVAAEFIHTIAGMNLEADTSTAHQSQPIVYDFDGKLEIFPGTLIWFAATKASVALFAQTFMWEEVLI